MSEIENTSVEHKLDKKHFDESNGTGVLGSIIFMVVMIVFMIVLANFVH